MIIPKTEQEMRMMGFIRLDIYSDELRGMLTEPEEDGDITDEIIRVEDMMERLS